VGAGPGGSPADRPGGARGAGRRTAEAHTPHRGRSLSPRRKPARTYYEVLGVSPEATKEEIRRAYRAAATRLHPDKNAAPDAEAKFSEVAQAYKTLGDVKKRQKYDLELAGPPVEVSTAPHFTWTNIASSDASVAMAEEERRERRTELDEMYDAFFGKKKGRTRRKSDAG
jgi:DnaJ-class molecular chaperone